MREHKYRAWNKRLGKMQQVLEIVLDPEFGGVLVWGKASVDFSTGEHEADQDFWTWWEIELMQYTGLKDREGKEVYEGDIVRSHRHKFNLIVKWCDGKGENLGNRVGWMLHDGYYHVDFTAYLAAHEISEREEYLNASVLGNIYEQCELLKTVGSFGYDPIIGEQS